MVNNTTLQSLLCVKFLFIYLFSQVIIEITETKVITTVENIQAKKINTNIGDIFGWEATRNHWAFTWGLPGTDKLNTYNEVEVN